MTAWAPVDLFSGAEPARIMSINGELISLHGPSRNLAPVLLKAPSILLAGMGSRTSSLYTTSPKVPP